MPWLRYFVCMGGLLLGVLFLSDALLPKDATEVRPEPDHPAIRIHSDRKWPERVVLDTSRPTIVPPQSATVIANAPAPAAPEEASKSRAAYAALDTPDPKQAQSADPAKIEKKLQRKRKIARRRVPPMMMAQQPQPQFGFFGNSWNGTW